MENKKYIYSIFDESNDYIAHDVSHYYDNEFGEGGGVDKTFDIITKKIGFNEANARYIIEQSPKFAVWLADSILKEEIAEHKVGYSLDGKVPQEQSLKNLALENINNRYSHIRNRYASGIRLILDWLKHPLTQKQNLRELSYIEAVDKARIFHEELKVLGGDVDFVEPDEHTIIKEYDEVDGVKYYWVLIPKNFCDVESGRMGHCGRTGSGNELISLRSIKPYGKGHTISDSHVTIAYGVEDGLFYQAKGKKNQKPAQKYHEYIFDLIKYLASDEFSVVIDRKKTGAYSVSYRASGFDAGKYFIYEGAREIKNDNGNIRYFNTEQDAYDYIDKLFTSIEEKYTYAFNGFGSEYDSTEDYDFEDMSKEEIKELYEIKPSIFDDFGGRIILYEADIIDERPSTTITIKKSAKDVEDLLDLSRDISSDFIENVLTGDTYQYFDSSNSWGYYYGNAEDYVNDLNDNNTNAVIDKIVEITSLSKEVVEENGIEHYLSGEDEDFEKDKFDDIIRSIASALESAEQDGYVSYYYKQIESALEELGEVKYLNDEGVSIEIDLADILSLSDISKYLKDLETNDLEDVFYEAISDGTIEKPDVRIDDRYSPYPKDINDYFDIDNYGKGGSIKKKRKKVAKVMREFKKGKLHIGKSDKIVKDRKQAVAIALSEAGLSKKENGGVMGDIYSIKDKNQFQQLTTTYNELSEKFDVVNYYLDNNDNSAVFLIHKDDIKNTIELQKYINSLSKRGFDVFDKQKNKKIKIEIDNSESGDYVYFKLKLSSAVQYSNGGWIEKLTFEEENFCVYVAEKFMGMEFDCEQKDCLKNIDKQKLKEKIVSIKEQLSGDGLTIANSIIDKI